MLKVSEGPALHSTVKIRWAARSARSSATNRSGTVAEDMATVLTSLLEEAWHFHTFSTEADGYRSKLNTNGPTQLVIFSTETAILGDQQFWTSALYFKCLMTFPAAIRQPTKPPKHAKLPHAGNKTYMGAAWQWWVMVSAFRSCVLCCSTACLNDKS